MTTDWTEIDNRLQDPTWYEDRDTFLAGMKKLRDQDPVHWAEDESFGRSYWFLTRHDHLRTVLADHASFSSRHFWTASRPPSSPRRMTLEERYELGLESRVSNLDPPMHTYLRRPVNRHFSVPAIGKLRDDIQRYVDDIVAEVREKDTFDLIEDVATELPVRVILRMLGVPEEDWEFLLAAAGRYTQSNDPRYLVDGDAAKTATLGMKQVVDYAVELAKDRQANPRDDFATVATNITVEGEKFSVYELRGWFSALILGGIETSRNAIGAGIWNLVKDPEQRRHFLDATTAEATDMVDEIIRWTSPARTLLRVATKDLDLDGKEVRQGDWVFACLAAGNNDDRVFDDPSRFDVTRPRLSEHLGLGDGIHKCLGRNMVRLEVAILAQTLLTALPELTVLSEPRWLTDVSRSGLTALSMSTHA